MLYLNARFNRAFRDLLRSTMSNWNYDVIGYQSRIHGNYVRRLNTDQAMMPYAVNNIEIVNTTHIISEYEGHTIADVALRIQEMMERSDEAECHHIFRVLTTDIDAAVDAMTFLEAPITGVQEIYGKCAEQVSARQGVNNVRYIAKVKGNHLVVFANYEDTAQASDIYLTIGILPVLFSDIKEKFEQAELEYCKELVHRSQLKRITNITVSTLFNRLANTRKYNDISSELLLTATVTKIVESKMSAARYTVDTAHNDMDRSLDLYQTARNKYLKATKLLTDLEGSKADLKEDMQLALKLDTIKNVNVNHELLDIMFSAAVKFYDTDEAECAIKRLSDGFVKQFITDVFIENKYKLHVSAVFKYTLADDPGYQGLRQVSIDEQQYLGGLANPHIQFYSCVGDYRITLVKAQTDRDLLMFNSVASASTTSLNFKVGTVMNRWFEHLQYIHDNYQRSYDATVLYKDTQCLETPDGNRYSLYDIYTAKVLELPNDEESYADATELDVEEL
jgi:hypothetical protein